MSRCERPKRIAVLRPGALGDAVVTLPVLASLRAAAPGARVLAIGSGAFRLATECGLAAGWMAFDDVRLLGLFAEGGAADVLAGCDLCLSYGKGDDPLLEASLARSGVAKVVSWPSRPAGAQGCVAVPAGGRSRRDLPSLRSAATESAPGVRMPCALQTTTNRASHGGRRSSPTGSRAP